MVHAINAICCLVSAWYAVVMFNQGFKVYGWLNVAASAFNLAALLYWFSV